MAKTKDSTDTLLADNRKSRFSYAIEDTFEAGIVLRGTEVKSCRAKKVNLSDGYCMFKNNELYVHNVQIDEFSHGNRFNHQPKAARKLLMHEKELIKLENLSNAGSVIIPLKMYLKNSFIKLLIGVGKGKKTHDKRHDLKKQQAKREIDRQWRR